MYETEESQVETNETPTAEPAAPEVSNEPDEQPANNNRPAGFYPVDVSELPEEVRGPINDRFNYLYKQVRRNDRTVEQYRQLAAEQSKTIEQLMQGQSAIVNHIQDRTFTETETNLQRQMDAAFEAGDQKAYREAQTKLIQLEVEKATMKKAAPEKKPQAPQQESTLSPEDDYVVNAWIEEERNGNPVRPWAQSGHPDFQAAWIETNAVLRNPQYSHMNLKQKLDEVDRRMGIKQQANKQAVMGGNLTTPRKNNTIALSAEAQQIAIRTKYAGPGKSDAEHIAAYQKQIQKTKTRRS